MLEGIPKGRTYVFTLIGAASLLKILCTNLYFNSPVIVVLVNKSARLYSPLIHHPTMSYPIITNGIIPLIQYRRRYTWISNHRLVVTKYFCRTIYWNSKTLQLVPQCFNYFCINPQGNIFRTKTRWFNRILSLAVLDY